MSKIYIPAEDSYLLKQCVERFLSNNQPMKILDMGSGSGIQTETMINLGINTEKITCTDINSEAIHPLSKKFPNSKIIQSDLFENIKEKFGLIIFNPPYLPEDKDEPQNSRLATTGGKKGGEIINRFLKQAKEHLTSDGRILLLTSSLTKGINWFDYKKQILDKKKLFFEELYVWELEI